MKTKKITLNELREVVKELIREYDVESFKHKYNKLPTNRKDKISDFLTKRQVRDGYALVDKTENVNLFFTKEDIGLSQLTLRNIDRVNINDILPNIGKMINILKNNSLSTGELEINKEFNVSVSDLVDLSKKPYDLKDDIKVKGGLSINNLLLNDGDKGYSCRGVYSGVLKKLDDSYSPPFNLVIDSINITSNSFEGYFTPIDNKTAIFLKKKIEEELIKRYKYNMGKTVFIKNVTVDKNAFYK